MKSYRWVVLLIIMMLAGLAGCTGSSGPQSGGGTGNVAHAFTLPDLNGAEVKFPADFTDYKVALVFFSLG